MYISTSKNMQIYNNTLEHNFRGIHYFLNCAAVGGGTTSFDLANNAAHDNTITSARRAGRWRAPSAISLDCTSTQLAPYLNGSKNLTFSRNTYHVPSLTGLVLGVGRPVKYWNEWQALGQDADGTVSQ